MKFKKVSGLKKFMNLEKVIKFEYAREFQKVHKCHKNIQN